jgi:hypothetical protein
MTDIAGASDHPPRPRARNLRAWLLRASRALDTRRWEQFLLLVLLASKVVSLVTRWDQVHGHDAMAQMEVTGLLRWGNLDLGLRQCFNCYQPPLGFLIPKVFSVLGFNATESAQLASFTASLVGFFCLRAALARVGLLRRPAGVVFLYFTSGIPLQNYLTIAITLDAFMYAWACVTLYLSVRLYWPLAPGVAGVTPPPSGRTTWLLRAALVVVLASSVLVKYSGVTLFAIPFLVALVQPRPRRFRGCASATLVAVVAVVVALPYFYGRYYRQTGEFLPMNHEWSYSREVKEVRAKRDADRVQFFIDLFSPTAHAQEHPNLNDQKVCRLHDTWRFYWVRARTIGWAGESAYKLSRFYIDFMPWVMLLGAWAFFRRSLRPTPWSRWGWVMVMNGLVQLAAIIQHNYAYPWAWGIPVKAFYISPSMWTLGLGAAGLVSARALAPHFLARRWRLGIQLIYVLVAVFCFTNYYMGIY